MRNWELYLKSKFLNNPNWELPPQISKKNMDTLKMLVDQILLNRNGWESYIYAKSEIRQINKFLEKQNMELLEDESMVFAKDAVLEQLTYGMKYELHIDGRIVNVYLVFPKYVREEKVEKQYLRKIVGWLKLAFQYAKPTVASPNSNCAKHLDVYLFLTNLKKILPTSQLSSSKSLLNRIHVNTAFTTPCTEDTYIMLYRHEEWFKVLIHETFHCLGLDFSHVDNAKSNRGILELFQHCDPKTDVRLSETYCEVWAEVINVLFYVGFGFKNIGRKLSITSPKPTVASPKFNGNGKMKSRKLEKNIMIAKSKTHKKYKLPPQTFLNKGKQWKQMERDILHQLQLEQAFSLYQSVKVLNYNGLKYPELCDGHPHIPKYREETQVLSYFVIKGILMYHLDTFLTWCGEYNANPLQFTSTTEVVQKYVELVKEKYLENRLLKNMDLVSKGILEKSPKNDSQQGETQIDTTLRMSVTDTELV